ncbi:MAG: efflux transporter outer membrane subunit [Cardiobacteriaceae bacterium]|nr:efflux transporter outer membrane subunit [Cardiobacteriaceae bacterium]
MVKNYYTKRLLSLFFITTLTACTIKPIATPEQDIASLSIPAHWMHAHADAQQQSGQAWWHHYRDPQLNQLIAQALAHNPNLDAAALNWRQSLIAVDETLARQAPQYSGDLAARASRDFDAARTSHSFSANLAASYQLDLWQKRDAQHAASAASADASGEDYLAARLALTGQVAKTYFHIQYLDDQLAAHARFLNNSEERLARSRAKLAAGSIARLDLLREEQNLLALKRERQSLNAQRQKAEASLAVLLGKPPAALHLIHKPLREQHIPDIPATLPAHLLAQRPDLRAAQYQLQAALANIAVAERDFYPDLSLTASLGSSSQALIRLLQNPVANLGASLSLPFLQRHDKEIALLRNQLAYDKTLKTFAHNLYQAFVDVENALITREQLNAEGKLLAEQLGHARRIEQLTAIREQAGADALQDVLEAKNSREQAESAILSNRHARLDNSIDLYLALGGNTALNP